MNINEVVRLIESNSHASALVLVDDENLYSLSEHNILGGVCDCCKCLNVVNGDYSGHANVTKVLRVVDLLTMTVIYEDTEYFNNKGD